MAIGEVYQTTLRYTYMSREMAQTWFYRQIGGGTSNAAPLAAGAFGNNVFPTLQDMLPPAVTFVQQLTYNIARPVDYDDYLFPGATNGERTVTGEQLATFVAWQCVSNRAQPGSRRSRKRFPGLYEPDVNGNQLSAAFLALTQLDDLLIAMGAQLTNVGHTFEPVCVSRPISLGTVPTVSYVITDWSLSPNVTTQNSRKD